MAYNTNLSRSRGRGFEVQVVDRLKGLGYSAKKVLLSGSHLAKPYDVIVKGLRLKIEAKRTMKDYISLQGKWLDKVSDKLILVFAVGRYSGGRTIEMWALSPCPHPMLNPSSAILMRKNKRIYREELPFWLSYNGKPFAAVPLEDYMESRYPLENKEKKNESGAAKSVCS